MHTGGKNETGKLLNSEINVNKWFIDDVEIEFSSFLNNYVEIF